MNTKNKENCKMNIEASIEKTKYADILLFKLNNINYESKSNL